MIVGASYPYRENTIRDVELRQIHSTTLHRALIELAPHLQFDQTYQFTITNETVSIGNPKIYDEYRVLIRMEDITR